MPVGSNGNRKLGHVRKDLRLSAAFSFYFFHLTLPLLIFPSFLGLKRTQFNPISQIVVSRARISRQGYS